MRRLSKEKQQQLVLTALVTLALLCGLWYGLIRAQQRSLASVAEQTIKVEKQLAEVKSTIARAEDIEIGLKKGSAQLTEIEESMATGDIYAWLITRVREFKNPYSIDIPQFSQISGPKNMDLLPDFPYKQASLTIAGTGRFHDVGMFISDFENQYPFARLCNVILEPANATPGGDKEKLAFRMEIVALVKPAGATL